MKILIVDNGLEFSTETLYNKCLGGSEVTALLLGLGLSEIGHQVVIVNTNKNKQETPNLIIDSINNFYPYAEIADVILLNRYVPPTIMDFIGKKKVFYMSHDAYDQQNVKWLMNANAEQYLNKIICVSKWQRNTFINYMRVNPDKLTVLGNPIIYSLYQGYTERDPNKLVFTSIPYKGLDVLPDLFNEICIRSKNDNLHLHIYSSFELYNREKDNETYSNAFKELMRTKSVYVYRPIPMNQLAFVFKSSSLNLAPSTYHETFGRVFVESAAAGCLTVAMNNGANKEIIGDNGFVLDYPNIYNTEAFDCFVDKVCELLSTDLYSKRVNAEREMKKWNYTTIAKQLEKIFIDN